MALKDLLKSDRVVSPLTDLPEIARAACADKAIGPGYSVLRRPHIDGFKIHVGYVKKGVVQRSLKLLKNAPQRATTEMTI